MDHVYYYNKEFKLYVLNQVEADVLKTCAQLSGSSTTNSEVKLNAKLDMPARI